MFKSALERPQKNFQTGRTTSKPAPTGGWNRRDPIAAMAERFAITMDNWIPREEYVEMRKGWVEFVADDGLIRPRYFLRYSGSTGVDSIFVTAEDTNVSVERLYDITTGAYVTVAGITPTTGVWQYVNFATTGGVYMLACDGNMLLNYDGTTWVVQDALSTPSLTGILPSEIFAPNMFKRRIWFLENNSRSAWYLPINAVGGAAVEFPMGPLFREGGYLIAQGTWTIDAGDGADDYIAFITNEGEVAVYGGIDPASDFVLRGVYRIPKPIGKRCVIKYNGDLLILTEEGIYPLSKALGSVSGNTRQAAITDNISTAFRESARAFPTSDIWQMTLYTEDNLLIVHVPLTVSGTTVQYVLNLITGAWCRFLGFSGLDFVVANKKLLLNTGTQINWCLEGYEDGVDGLIVAELKTAYSYLTRDVNQKHIKLVRPQFILDGNVDIMLAIGVDYDLIAPFQTALIEFLNSATGQAIWDESLWDASLWSLGEFTALEWKTINALPGFTFSLGVRASSNSFFCKLAAYDYLYDAGFVL